MISVCIPYPYSKLHQFGWVGHPQRAADGGVQNLVAGGIAHTDLVMSQMSCLLGIYICL